MQTLSLIDQLSRSSGFNPLFTAGLIAEESGFNSSAVSWAHALGLTQVTPIAEEELKSFLGDWPHYPQVNTLPAPIVKAMVLTGQLNSANEWRLNRKYSILGGLAYIRKLASKWAEAENRNRILRTYGTLEPAYTQLILASYNFGYSRVLQTFKEHKQTWLDSRSIAGARTYVNRVVSYCDYFSETEVPYENET